MNVISTRITFYNTLSNLTANTFKARLGYYNKWAWNKTERMVPAERHLLGQLTGLLSRHVSISLVLALVIARILHGLFVFLILKALIIRI